MITFRMLSAAIVSLFLISGAAAETLLLNIAGASVKQDSMTRKPVLAIELDQASKKDFDAFTAAHLGSKTELRLDGKVLAEPAIREPITGGLLEISGGYWTDAMASEFAKQASMPGAKVEIISK